VLLTTVLNRTERSTAAATPTPLWRGAAYVAVLLAAAFAIVATNLDVSRADIVSKQVQSYLRRGALMAARRAAEEALRMQPWNDHYATDLGSIFMDLARNAAPARRVEYLTQAQQVLERAEHIGPLNVDNPRNLARLHHLWATLVEDPGEQTQHFEAAERFHDLATRLSPMNASLWNEWALLCIARHQTDRALALLDHSLEIDNLYPTTNWLRANIYMERQMYEQALADYERALSFKPRLLAAWSGKALALTRLNRFDDAIAANRSALAVNPNDLISHRNLALLYRQTNQLDLALSEAKAALAAAVPPDDEPLKTFIAQLQEQLASGQ
ncbi:MAG TPA: tetratricopeptide repeat protein, partial [Candidatus Kryptonia bacterium]|nr:tetratricopeptide repeat protein [Candidatus Kryptonia bacterium]